MRERKLNLKQTDLIKLVYKFRYVTTDNAAKQRNTSSNAAYSALENLFKNGYLGKIHKKSYRLQNKSARYYIDQKGIKYIKNNIQYIDPESLPSRLRDRSKSEDFIDQQVAIHAAYVTVQEKYGEKAKILTGPEMHSIEGIIKPLPSLYVKPQHKKHFFIELTDGQHLFIVKKRIRKYIENYEADEWEWDEYPDVYILRNSKADRAKLEAYLEEKMDDNYLDEEDFKFKVLDKLN